MLAIAVVLGLLSGARAQAADHTGALDEILSRGKVIVGVAAYIKPLAFSNPQTGDIEGFMPDLVRLYAQKLDVKVEFMDYKWAGLFPALDTKKVDFLAAHLTTTMPRTAKMDLSRPFLYTGSRVLVRKAVKADKLEDLNSEKITFSQSKGSMYNQVVEKRFPKAKIQRFDTFADTLQALKTGRVDATVDDEVIILFGGLQGNENQLKALKDNLSPGTFRFAARRGETEMRRSLDIFIEEIKLTGEYKELYEKWFKTKWVPQVIGE
jgi:ABC-type amino acid transport substrate-binding protein